MSKNIMPFAVGFVSFFLIRAIFMFFPAFVMSIAVSRWIFGNPNPNTESFPAEAVSFISFFIFIAVIMGLQHAKQYFIVLIIYLVAAWPFINILCHFWNNTDDSLLFPLPIDWCFFI